MYKFLSYLVSLEKYIKNRLRRSCFPVIVVKFFRKPIAPKVVSQ